MSKKTEKKVEEKKIPTFTITIQEGIKDVDAGRTVHSCQCEFVLSGTVSPDSCLPELARLIMLAVSRTIDFYSSQRGADLVEEGFSDTPPTETVQESAERIAKEYAAPFSNLSEIEP